MKENFVYQLSSRRLSPVAMLSLTLLEVLEQLLPSLLSNGCDTLLCFAILSTSEKLTINLARN